VLVQALLAKTAVERFDEGIVRGLARPGEIQDHPMGIGPEVYLLGDELRAIIHPDPLRHPILGHCQVEGRDHIVAFIAEFHPNNKD
jgi:hypothetical protein